MTKLTDTQSILLSTASQRDGGSLYPLPTTLTAPKPAIAKSVAALLVRGLAEQRETDDPMAVARTDGGLRYGVFITPAGLSAIGAGEGEPEPLPVVALVSSPTTKSAAVIALLQRATGATLPELIAATGWLWQQTAKGAGFTMVTCDPNALVAPIHPKAMITILHPDDHERWLRGNYDDVVALQRP